MLRCYDSCCIVDGYLAVVYWSCSVWDSVEMASATDSDLYHQLIVYFPFLSLLNPKVPYVRQVKHTYTVLRALVSC